MASTTGYQVDNVGRFIKKDPSSVLDYTIDWTNWLSGDTVSSVVYDLENGITTSTAIGGVAVSNTTTTTTVNIAGGTAGNIYNVKCTMTTTNGRTVVKNFRIKVEDIFL